MKILLLALVSLTAHAGPKPKEGEGMVFQAALADPARPAEDRADDEHRKPAALLQLARLRPGESVVDFMPGKGYFTRIFAKVVGPKGHVTADVPEELKDAKYKPVENANAAAKGYANVTVLVTPLLKQDLHDVDLFWTSLNYHDLHTKSFAGVDVGAFDKAVFAALKPGGRFVVVDHAAAPGTLLSEADRLHRIDPAIVKAEVEAAGFKLVRESDALKSAADTHQLPVFDPAIKGKTDQFVYVFEKPKK